MRNSILVSIILCVSFSVRGQQQQQTDSTPIAYGWLRVPFPASTLNACLGLSFINPDTGWVVGEDGAFYSTDAGQHWQLRVAGQYGQVHFFDVNEGWLLYWTDASSMLHTSNGGTTWDTVHFPATNVHWINRDTGFILGRALIERITRQDTGWSRTISGNLDAGGIICLDRFDANHYLALGDEHFVSSQYPNSPTILRSDDAGESWYRPEWAEGNGIFYDILIVDSTRAVGFGNNWRTSDRGSTWISDTTLGVLRKVSFLADGFGMGCSRDGFIGVSTDTGHSWTYENTGTLETTTGIQVVDTANAFAIGTNGLVLRTTNGGFSNVNQNAESGLTINSYPDPALLSLIFTYSLPQFQHVTFSIYSLSGSLVATLANMDAETTGNHSQSLNTSNLASGTYSYVLSSEDYTVIGQFQVIH